MLPNAIRQRLANLPTARIQHVHVGNVGSAKEAVNQINKYVADHSTRHDLSTASFREVWILHFGAESAQANLGGVQSLLNAADACATKAALTAAGKCGVKSCDECDASASMVFNGMNKDLGLPGDNGWMTFTQIMQWLGRYPVNADDPPGETAAPSPSSDPSVIDDADRRNAALTDQQISDMCAGPVAFTMGGMDACRATFEKGRADAKAKIARLTPAIDILPNTLVSKDIIPATPKKAASSVGLSTTEKAVIGVGVPTVVGGLAALKWGVLGAVTGGVLGLAAVGVGAYFLTRKKPVATPVK